MSHLANFLTTKQIQTLTQAKINNLYDLITYMPSGITKIKPLISSDFTSFTVQDNLEQESVQVQFLMTAKILDVTKRAGNTNFLQIQTNNPIANKLYYFGYIKNPYAQFQNNLNYQFLLRYKSPFWQIIKFRQLQSALISGEFILGRAKSDQIYWLPKYQKIQQIQPGYFNLIHKKIPKQAYILDLKNLVPSQGIIPEKLDLSLIHHPSNLNEFQKSLANWQTFQAFLILCKHRYISQNRAESKVEAVKINLQYLKKISSSLGFELSNSQKTVIWQILQKLAPVDHNLS